MDVWIFTYLPQTGHFLELFTNKVVRNFCDWRKQIHNSFLSKYNLIGHHKFLTPFSLNTIFLPGIFKLIIWFFCVLFPCLIVEPGRIIIGVHLAWELDAFMLVKILFKFLHISTTWNFHEHILNFGWKLWLAGSKIVFTNASKCYCLT